MNTKKIKLILLFFFFIQYNYAQIFESPLQDTLVEEEINLIDSKNYMDISSLNEEIYDSTGNIILGYKNEYNLNGLLSRSIYFNYLRDYSDTLFYEYNKEGYLISTTKNLFVKTGGEFKVLRNDIGKRTYIESKLNNKKTKVYYKYSRINMLDSIVYDSSTYVIFHYDKSNLIKKKEYFANSKCYQTYEYQHFSKNNYKYEKKRNQDPILKVEVFLNDNQNVLKFIYQNIDSSERYIYEYTYKKNYKISTLTITYPNNNISQSLFVYDKKNRLIEIVENNKQSKILSRIIYRYTLR